MHLHSVTRVKKRHHADKSSLMMLCASYHVRPVEDEDFRGLVRAQLQGFLHQRDVFHFSARLEAK